MRHFYSSIIFIIALTSSAAGQTIIKPKPTEHLQQWKGWGISLAWWANCMGDWGDSTVNEISNWITSPDELSMNVFRYNIGGGDNPTHSHMRKDGADIPGYKPTESGDYDFSLDAKQRNFLLKLNSLRKDAFNELESYTPPWWMTISGCSSGNTDGSDNLKDEYYDDFAEYLTTAVLNYKSRYGITFSTLSPMNEPFSNWWKAMGGQEGCAFSQENQQRLIKEVYKSLEKNNMLGYCSISAMDANGLGQCVKGIEGYEKTGDIIPLIKQVNTHSYADTSRVELGRLARKLGLRLWQSESGPLDVNLTGFDNYLFMAQRIVTDIRELEPEVWCDWQLASQGLGDGRWGLLSYDPVKKIYQREKSYYVRKQFSKYIKPGFRFIGGADKSSLAALSPDGKELVIVMVNQDSGDKSISIDFSDFSKTAKFAKVYRTSMDENCNEITKGLPVVNKKGIYMVPAKSVTTIQLGVTLK